MTELGATVPPMGRFAPHYSDKQAQAVAAAMLDHGLPAPEIVRKASAGELDGLDPFEIPKGSVYYIASRERRRREATAEAEEASTLPGKLRQQGRRAVDLLEAELDRIERNAKETGKCDHVALSKVVRSLATLSRADLSSKPAATDGKAKDNNAGETPFMARLRECAAAMPPSDASGV